MWSTPARPAGIMSVEAVCVHPEKYRRLCAERTGGIARQVDDGYVVTAKVKTLILFAKMAEKREVAAKAIQG